MSIVSCTKDSASVEAYQPVLPPHFPEITYPVDNEWSESRWLLGRKMFFDPIMSADGKVSCASCHDPSLAFSDDVALSPGFEGILGRSNAPTLVNVAYHPHLTRAGGVPTLEQQVLVPIQEHDEFNTNILEIVERMSKDDNYQSMSREAYDRPVDPFVIVRAISNYERTIISGNSRYDQYINGDMTAMSSTELKGMELFFSDELKCASCHAGFNFTEYAFENNGLKLDYGENDRKRFTGLAEDEGKIKVPTLRNISVTGPYMHDGSLSSLEEVIEHYDSGGVGHWNQSDEIGTLGLTEDEKSSLIAFLNSLEDETFLNNLNYR